MRSTVWHSSIEIGRRKGTAQAMDERASGSPNAQTCGSFASDSGRSPVVRRMSQADPLRTFGLAYEIEMLLLHHRIQLLTWPRGMSGMPQFFGQTGAAASMRLSIN